jgi:Flp pilus assembly protein TadB
MYNKNSHKDILGGAIAAALGAGIVTTFGVWHGQSPLVALQVTGLAVIVALVCDRLGLV